MASGIFQGGRDCRVPAGSRDFLGPWPAQSVARIRSQRANEGRNFDRNKAGRKIWLTKSEKEFEYEEVLDC